MEKPSQFTIMLKSFMMFNRSYYY